VIRVFAPVTRGTSARRLDRAGATANAGAFRDLREPKVREQAAGFGFCRILLAN